MHADFATLRSIFNLGACRHTRRRQTGERSQVLVARRRRMCIVAPVPVERGERAWNPIEVAAYRAARGIVQRQIDEEDSVGIGVKTLRQFENPLRAVDARIHRRVCAEQFLPCQVVYMDARMQSPNRLIGAIHHHDGPIVIRVLNMQRFTGLLRGKVSGAGIQIVVIQMPDHRGPCVVEHPLNHTGGCVLVLAVGLKHGAL